MPSEFIKCVDRARNPDTCEGEFEFTENEQAFFEQKGFTPPKRCRDCRQLKKERMDRGQGGNFGGGRDAQEYA